MSNGRLSVLCSQPLESCFQFSALFAASSSGPIQIATDAPRGRGLPGILAGPRRFKRHKVSGSGLVARHNGHTLLRHCAAEDCRFGRKGRQAPTAIRVPHLQGSVAGGRNGLPILPVTATVLTEPRIWGQVIQGLEELARVLADCPTGDRRGLVSTRFQALLGPGSPGVGMPALPERAPR